MKVFVLESDRSLRAVYDSLLTKRGHSVAGAGASASMDQLDPDVDVVVIDFCSPLSKGREFLAGLRANAASRDIPTLILTDELEYRAVEDGARSTHLAKPFSYERFVQAVERAATRRGTNERTKAALLHVETSCRLARRRRSLPRGQVPGVGGPDRPMTDVRGAAQVRDAFGVAASLSSPELYDLEYSRLELAKPGAARGRNPESGRIPAKPQRARL